MIKNYQDFIFERFYPNTFSMHWEDLINIYKDQIVPKIGKIIKFENHITSGILDKSTETHFHQLRSTMKDYRTEFVETLIDLDKFYGKSCLSPTGPELLGANIDKYMNINIDLFHYIHGGYIIYKNRFVISTIYPEYNNERSSLYNAIKTKGYTELWNERKIYK